MKTKSVFVRVQQQGYSHQNLVDDVRENLSLLPEIIEGISSNNKRMKNACARVVQLLSAEYPEKFYPHIDIFIRQLDGDDTILKWIAIDTICNLASVDRDNTVSGLLNKFFVFLSDDSMITAAHVIENIWKIAKAKPEYQKQIVNQLLRVARIPRNEECRNILLGKTIMTFAQLYNQIEEKKKVYSFVERQTNNQRSGTRTKAVKFLKQFSKV